MKCEYFESCGFIENTNRIDPATVPAVETTYCKDDKFECVRYCLERVLGSDIIPDQLWPNDNAGAFDVIKTRLHNERKIIDSLWGAM